AENLHLVVDQKLLRDALGDIGNAAIILDDELDLLAGDGVALLLDVELGACRHLLADGGELAGHRDDQPDFDGLLRSGRPERQGEDARGKTCDKSLMHRFLPLHTDDYFLSASLEGKGLRRAAPPMTRLERECEGCRGRDLPIADRAIFAPQS